VLLTILILSADFLLLGWLLIRQQQNQSNIDMKLAQLVTALAAVDTKLTEAQTEIVSEIAKLKAALEDVDVPADAQAALDNIAAKAGTLADIVPNPPTE
jgi:hypothetical protein